MRGLLWRLGGRHRIGGVHVHASRRSLAGNEDVWEGWGRRGGRIEGLPDAARSRRAALPGLSPLPPRGTRRAREPPSEVAPRPPARAQPTAEVGRAGGTRPRPRAPRRALALARPRVAENGGGTPRGAQRGTGNAALNGSCPAWTLDSEKPFIDPTLTASDPRTRAKTQRRREDAQRRHSALDAWRRPLPTDPPHPCLGARPSARRAHRSLRTPEAQVSLNASAPPPPPDRPSSGAALGVYARARAAVR